MAGGKAAQKLGDAFFKHIQARKAPSLFKKMMRSLDSGQYHVPKSFEVLASFPTEELKLQHPRPVTLTLPEHTLLRAFYAQYPEAKLEPTALQSLDPPLAKKFVWRQMQLMQEPQPGVAQSRTQLQAVTFQRVEEEMRGALREMQRRANVAAGHTALIQQEEEVQLRAALDQAAMQAPAVGAPGAGTRRRPR